MVMSGESTGEGIVMYVDLNWMKILGFLIKLFYIENLWRLGELRLSNGNSRDLELEEQKTGLRFNFLTGVSK